MDSACPTRTQDRRVNAADGPVAGLALSRSSMAEIRPSFRVSTCRDSLHTQRDCPTRFSVANNVTWKDKDSGEHKTRAEWHRIVVWGRLGEWEGYLKKGAFIEAEGELRYRSFQPNGSDAKIRTAEIHASSILTLDSCRKNGARRRDRGCRSGWR
jgi:Single-strand binding protein family